MDKAVANAAHLHPWYLRMRKLKLFRHMGCRLANSGYVKCRSILQTQVFKEISLAHIGKDSPEALYSFYHVQKPLHVSVNTINHSSIISFFTL